MKKTILAVMVSVLPAIAGTYAAAQGDFANDDQKTLYFLGTAVSSKVKQLGFTTEESKYIIMGFSDSMNGVKPKVDESYGPKLNEFLSKKQTAALNAEKEKGRVFIEKMAKQSGAVKLPSGVVYIPVKAGKGGSPKETDMVKVHYHGTLPDGKVFDSSVDRGTPAEFPLSGVIPCWTEGVQKMKVGGKAKLVCPSDSAYGDQGAGGAIPGGSALMFEVELIEILKTPAQELKTAAPAKEQKAAAPAKQQTDDKPAGK